VQRRDRHVVGLTWFRAEARREIREVLLHGQISVDRGSLRHKADHTCTGQTLAVRCASAQKGLSALASLWPFADDRGTHDGRCVMEVFDDTFIPPGLSGMRGASRRCPRCVWTHLHPVGSLDESHWLCESCGHCWRIEHGRLRPVDPIACHGCTARSKRVCMALLQSEFPRFGAGAATGDASS